MSHQQEGAAAVPSSATTHNMATETVWNCPICRDIPGEIASVTPCVHLFCLGCIVRWAKTKPSCPLCRQAINSIIYSVRSEEDFLEIVLPSPSASSAAHHQDEQGAAELMPRAYIAGFPPEVWADFFQDCSEILEPLLPWLNQELTELLRTRWWEVALAQSAIVANLCRYGLREEALVRELHPLLQEQTVAFVQRLIDTAAERCSDEILRHMNLLNSRAEEEDDEEQESPTAIPDPSASPQGTPTPTLASSCSPVVSKVEADAGTLEDTLRGGPGHSPSAPVPAEREQPQEEPGSRAAAAAGPSAQGYSRSPSPPGRDRDCLPEGPRRPAKRRASGPQDSPTLPKRPSRRRRCKSRSLDCRRRK
ncbi:E3 ubiquitin-protein ligase Topors-like [Anomalospiza imberbis]|uniref:E3 ubiquitin-protein ligase Topors-like n=1 Tax=Anomalospiza imberbis TaxID=187417 RepID=UPI0035902DC8